MAIGGGLPAKGTVFISVHDYHKNKIVPVAKEFADLGFTIVATRGTAEKLNENGVKADIVFKMSEGRPNVVDHIKNGDIHMIINTSIGRRPSEDAYHIRQSAITYNIPYVTTIAGSRATGEAIRALQKNQWSIRAIQDYYK